MSLENFHEGAFDAFIKHWQKIKDENFPDLKEGDPRTGAAYVGFIAGFKAALGEPK